MGGSSGAGKETPMIGIAKGVAHVSFSGGGMFVPARSPYDRQLLVEHVLDGVRRRGNVQVLVDDQRWLVHLLRDDCMVACWRCGCAVDSICHCTADDAVAYCVTCAF